MASRDVDYTGPKLPFFLLKTAIMTYKDGF